MDGQDNTSCVAGDRLAARDINDNNRLQTNE